MLRDHLADEARHSRYFAEVFHYLWLSMNSRQRMFRAEHTAGNHRDVFRGR
jgi:hypothetical protein